MTGFESLTLALEGWFEKPLSDLPDGLRERVENEDLLKLWDSLSANQRRSAALDWDRQYDPANRESWRFLWESLEQEDEIKETIRKWEDTDASTVDELEKKETRLAELRQKLFLQKQRRGPLLDEYSPGQKLLDENKNTSGVRPSYIPFPAAMKILFEQLDATREEVAAWVAIGSKDNGLDAYTNANELVPPHRFYFASYPGAEDYIAPLMICWFKEEDIANFQPANRYITGTALMEHWGKQADIQAEAFIQAKIRESRLSGVYPTYSAAEDVSHPGVTRPPLTSGLFVLADVERIEVEDFGKKEIQGKPSYPKTRPFFSSASIRAKFAVYLDPDQNDDWWKSVMREAKRNGLADCRVGEGKKGHHGSQWRPDWIANWLVTRHKKGKAGLKAERAKAALQKFTGYEQIAEDLYPSDEFPPHELP